MSWVIYFFGSGAAFFSGILLVLAAALGLAACRHRWLVRIAVLLALLGLILVALSATPLPYWFYAAAGLTSLIWLWSERTAWTRLAGHRKWLRLVAAVTWLAAAAAEMPHQFVPVLNEGTASTLYIFADSVTAGMGESAVVTWPKSLARTYPIEVKDYSQMGAKVSTMARKVEGLSLGPGLILVEIGGNDVMGSTVATDYERALDKLLAMLTGPEHQVVMFELPLPPFCNEFGRIQRRLAKQYDICLIPKRIFVNVLTAEGATVDSVHLSSRGHDLMAETVWNIVRPAFALTTGEHE
jgi:acyl-CoA thioesterase-1